MSEVAQAAREPLVLFVIYDHPLDWPHHYVARRSFVFPGEEEPRWDKQVFATHLNLAHLRTMLPLGGYQVARLHDSRLRAPARQLCPSLPHHGRNATR